MTDFFPEEDTTMSYSGLKPEPTRLQAEGTSHHTGWAKFAVLPGNLAQRRITVSLMSCISCRMQSKGHTRLDAGRKGQSARRLQSVCLEILLLNTAARSQTS
ncbi:hypothetical protein TNCV_1292541 [Trichonephila clavipes]|nr:hypothetical protein TNCV_1292541 [Trichonephila clavipes]